MSDAPCPNFRKNSMCVDDLFTESMLCPESNSNAVFLASTEECLDDLAIGLMAFELKLFAEAETALLRVKDDDLSKFALAQEWLGTTYLKAGRPELALEPLGRAVQLDLLLGRDPLTVAECQLSLGLAYARTGHPECALAQYQWALESEPDWGTVLFEIARVHALRNRMTDAMAALVAAARQDEFFLSRAMHDCDFDILRKSEAFQRLLAVFGDMSTTL